MRPLLAFSLVLVPFAPLLCFASAQGGGATLPATAAKPLHLGDAADAALENAKDDGGLADPYKSLSFAGK